MSTHSEQITEILCEAEEMEEGPGQIALTEEAVRLADTHGDDDWGYTARMQLTKAASFGGRPDVAMVSFTWCLSQFDRNPEQHDEQDLLWHYKWMLQHIAKFPTVPRQQIESLLDDMSQRFRQHGSTLHAVHMIRRDLAVEMHDPEAAETANRRFSRLERDHLSDCAACVNDGTIEYHLFLGDDESAIETARPALEGRRGMTCAEVPHRTHAYVLLPLLRLGKLERATRSHLAGYKLIRQNPKFIFHKAYHLAFLTLTGNLARAARLFERHLPETLHTPGLSWQFEFFVAARLFLDRLCSGRAIPLVRVPEEVRVGGEPMMPATQIAAWMDGRIAELASAFDARNGNDGFTRKSKWFRNQARFATDYALD